MQNIAWEVLKVHRKKKKHSSQQPLVLNLHITSLHTGHTQTSFLIVPPLSSSRQYFSLHSVIRASVSVSPADSIMSLASRILRASPMIPVSMVPRVIEDSAARCMTSGIIDAALELRGVGGASALIEGSEATGLSKPIPDEASVTRFSGVAEARYSGYHSRHFL